MSTTEFVTKLLGLDHGPGYGRDWFRDIGTDVLKRLLEAHPLRSFAEIAAKWNEPNVHRASASRGASSAENAAHVRVLVERLARLGPRYNATAASGLPARVLGAAIDMTDFFRRPQVLYVEVAAQRAPLSASPVGRSFIHAAVDAGAGVPRAEDPPRYFCRRIQALAIVRRGFCVQDS